MFDRIEEFLYDFIGIIIPGFILILLISVYVSWFEQTTLDEFLVSSKLWKSIDFVEKYLLIAILFLSYFMGHLIILLSKIQYELCQKIFDHGILSYFRLNKKNFFSKWILEIFSYQSQSYSESNEEIKNYVLNLLSKRLSFGFQNEWYTIYKMSNIITNQEQISNRVNNYFAKYTFFKSIAFILWIHFFVLLLMLIQDFSLLFLVVFFVNFLFWLTFHSSYKRYWTMCGDESLLSLFYYLSK